MPVAVLMVYFASYAWLSPAFSDEQAPENQLVEIGGKGESFLETRHYTEKKLASSVQAALGKAKKFCEDNLWWPLGRCVQPLDDNTTYVVTGDIDAMWIRDSAAQLHPYIAVAKTEGPSSRLWPLLEGALRRQAKYILTDPYANAFKKDWDSAKDDRLNRGGYVATGNFELDSGAYFFRFLLALAEAHPETTLLQEKPVHNAVRMMVRLYSQERRHFELSEYLYPRSPPLELPGDSGRGLPVKYTGMVWGAFRPSDDAQHFGYHIPSNLFLASVLKPIAAMAKDSWQDAQLESQALDLRFTIVDGVQKHAVKELPDGSLGYCYEVDGLGGCNQMDDANVPSLLSLPYLDPKEETYDRQLYMNTRRFVLSTENPWFFAGHVGQGVGSPHTGLNKIWPLSMVMQALTAESENEADHSITMLMSIENVSSQGLTESVHKDNARIITRAWFGWPNALFAELQLRRNQCTPSHEHAWFPKRQAAPRDGPLAAMPPSIGFYEADEELLRRRHVTLPRELQQLQAELTELNQQGEQHSATITSQASIALIRRAPI